MKKLATFWNFIRTTVLADDIILWWMTLISSLTAIINDERGAESTIFFVGAVIVGVLTKNNKK